MRPPREPGRALGRPGRRAARYPGSSGGAYTTPGSSRQRRDHHPHRKPSTRSARAQPTPRPRNAPVLLLASPRPTRLSFASPRQFTPLASLTSSLASDLPGPDPPAAAPPEATPASRLGWPVQVSPGSSRKWGPARSGGPHFLQSPGGKPRKHPKAGRRPVALMGETHRAKQMEGNTRRETGVPPASAPYSPAPALGGSTHSTSPWGGRARSGGRPGARSAQ